MARGSWLGSPRGSSPAHPDAWCKVKLGLVKPVVIESNQKDVVIPPIELTRERAVFKLQTPEMAEEEYFLLENRQPENFDKALPGHGLLIYHIDERQRNNNDQTHYLVGLEQADGRGDLEQNVNLGDAGDPWPGSAGRTSFDNWSTPNSKAYDGRATYLSVRNIRLVGKNIIADIGLSYTGVAKKVKVVNKTALVLRYPNPFGISFQYLKGVVYNILGQTLEEGKGINSGIYFLKSDNQKILVIK
jgi:immune inhibitor A